MKLSEIAELISGELIGEDREITGINTLSEAAPGQITFLSNTRYAKFLPESKASAVIIDRKFPAPEGKSAIRVDNPYYATLKVVKVFHRETDYREQGVHSTAVVADSAQIAENAGIGAGVIVGENVTVGENTWIGPNTVIEHDVKIGGDCYIHANVTIRHGSVIGDRVIIHPGAVIGSDGFGQAPVDGRYEKIPQVGIVIIEDDADIGANTCIDRAFLGVTRIGKGVKLDNLIQIAHNVEVGPHTVIAAQTGISGSTRIGKGVMMGGQVGTVGHIEIGDGAKIGAQSGIPNDVAPDTTMFGYPARPIMETKRIEASLRKLPDMVKRLKQVEKTLEDLKK